MAADRRVKLVFAAALGRRLLRARGFSRCWFMLPARARLVGDVAHAIRAEFALGAAASVELRLEGLLLLPTHDARILRDHDELLVQQSASTPAIEADAESGGDERRKAKKLRKQQREAARADRRARKQAARKRSSSGSGSDSSSSGSESEEAAAVAKAKKNEAETEEETRRRKRQRTDAGGSTAPASGAAKAKSVAVESEKSGTEPKQRRRRRQRNRKPRDVGAKEASVSSATPPTPSEPAGAEQQSASHTELPDAAARGHVRFGASGEARAASSGGAGGAGVRHALKPRELVSPELQKYGPLASPSATREQHQPRRDPESAQQHRDAYPQHRSHQQQQRAPARLPNASAPDPPATARKAKAKFGTMWKRPYEIVATILDGASSSVAVAAPHTDISDLLAKFPTPCGASVSADAFQADDVVAYKTLTLCMETWQPVASEWLCGKVRGVTGDQVELLAMTLCTKEDSAGDSLQWMPKQQAEQHPDAVVAVQTGEVSDVRYLDGPSYEKLRVPS